MKALDEALRTAIIANDAITELIKVYRGDPAVHTRRPLPQEADDYPLILINPNIAVGDQDYFNTSVPVIVKDIVVYGNQSSDYRAVEDASWLLRELFHRKKNSISVEGYHTVMVTATGPNVGPTDSDSRVARVVTLTVTLQKRS